MTTAAAEVAGRCLADMQLPKDVPSDLDSVTQAVDQALTTQATRLELLICVCWFSREPQPVAEASALVAAALAVIVSLPDVVDQSIDWSGRFARLTQQGLWPMWYCRHQDGTVVYNTFRFYRSAKDVIDYFSGRSPRPDRDAFVLQDNRKSFIYYDAEGAREMVRIHGQIVDFGCVDETR